MEKTNDAEISLLDAPVGAVVDLVSWETSVRKTFANSRMSVSI